MMALKRGMLTGFIIGFINNVNLSFGRWEGFTGYVDRACKKITSYIVIVLINMFNLLLVH